MARNVFSFNFPQAIVMTVLVLSPCYASASTWNVPGDAATIQGGIDLASPGDTVLVGQGNWSGAGNVNLSFAGVDLVLLSSAGRDLTTLNCSHTTRGLFFASGETAAAIVQGFTIRNGTATTGGGLLIDEASPTIRDCRFVHCYASSHGGAADLQDYSAPRFEDCVFDSNSTTGDYHTGGAIRLYDNGEFVRCVFRDNYSEGIGGAIRMLDAGNITFESCVFERNEATDGGAVMIQSAISTDFESCIFVGNHVSMSGGALRFTTGTHTLTNCHFDLNSSDATSGAIDVSTADAILNNCTVARTTSAPDWGALTVTNGGADIDLNNTIVYGSLVGSGVQCRNYGDVTPVCSNLFGNADGDWDDWCGDGEDTINGNFSSDPLFCDPDNGNFQLSANSPCLNAPDCGLIGAFGQGCEQSSSVDDLSGNEFGRIDLGPVTPNPSNPISSISYRIPVGNDQSSVRLVVHDANGRLVREVINRPQSSGTYSVSWDGTNQSGRPVEGGVYFYQLTLGDETRTRQLILVR
jgi:FlgD Ig-like domain/Right handed beta helix region